MFLFFLHTRKLQITTVFFFCQEKVIKDKGKKTESQKKKREKSESPEKVCGLLSSRGNRF